MDRAKLPPNQFALLRQRRFAPFFWTQFLGAANDNLFKFALMVMVTYQVQIDWLPPALAGLAIGAVFILPFLLFSASGGQFADKWEKTRLIRLIKNLEIAIMLLGAYGFFRGQVGVLLVCTFLMGLHSTLFGPVKFAYLPQVLSERELTGGTGMVEMGTFVAILLGQVAGGLLIAVPGIGHYDVAIGCVMLALLGRFSAGAIPLALATDPALRINWNPVSETWRNLRLAAEHRVVFRSLLGISWMWFFGATYLSQFPSLAKEVLHGDEQVASFLLVVFSLGIGAGSLLCEKLGRRHVEIGLVPIGTIGMSLFSIDLYFSLQGLPASGPLALLVFLQTRAHWHIVADLALLSLFTGLFSVPMYALIQLRSPRTHRARIIAANNILNALFMIASALIAAALLRSGVGLAGVFLLTGLANLVVAGYIFLLVPEYLLRCVAWLLSRCIYRLRLQGEEHLPAEGAAVLLCHQIRYVDTFLLMAVSPRPIYFLMDQRSFQVPVLGWLLRLGKAIPVAPRAEDETAYARAMAVAGQVLASGDLLCIFPQHSVPPLPQHGEHSGNPVPRLPVTLNKRGSAFWRRVELHVGAAVPSTD